MSKDLTPAEAAEANTTHRLAAMERDRAEAAKKAAERSR